MQNLALSELRGPGAGVSSLGWPFGQRLERELARVRREWRISRSLTLSELVDTYLAQHDVQQVTIAKLRWLLRKATAAFGELRVGELSPHEIAAWRMTLAPGHRFEATQAPGRCSTAPSPGG
jgi:hypothetical protein